MGAGAKRKGVKTLPLLFKMNTYKKIYVKMYWNNDFAHEDIGLFYLPYKPNTPQKDVSIETSEIQPFIKEEIENTLNNVTKDKVTHWQLISIEHYEGNLSSYEV